MSIKPKLRSFLGDLLVKFPSTNNASKDKILDKQLIKNLVLEPDEAPSKLETGSIGGCVRILTKNVKNSQDIAHELKQNQSELGIQSIHIADRAIECPKAGVKQEPIHKSSVVIKYEPLFMLKSALLLANDRPYFHSEVLESHQEIYGERQKNIVLDFSSPNIAKPFHFGHLKSTILGNYLANLNQYLGNRVTKLNYIGDWGTQYGLLNLGLEEFGEFNHRTDKSPLRYLLDIYVKANKKGQEDENFYSEAKRKFALLEKGEASTKELEKWRSIRDLSLDELRLSYRDLGIEFDVFEFESDYVRKAKDLIRQLEGKSFVRRLEDGVVVAQVSKNGRQLEVPIMRSDGASLYMTRDVCAAINRMNNYQFDQMLYVVGADQEKHFHCLGELVKGLGYDWHDRLIHVKMGKVLGMSSRLGESVLLADIIKEATERYIESTRSTPTTKVRDKKEMEEVGRHLALSALFVYDMRNARTKNYEFDWKLVMMAHQRSGINLQTSFARLESIMRRAAEIGLEPVGELGELSADAICCLEGVALLSNLLELDTALHHSYWSMDPSPLVNHGLKLCRAINRARQSPYLMVVQEPDEMKARTRLSLFRGAQQQLEFIIKLIGLKPLERV